MGYERKSEGDILKVNAALGMETQFPTIFKR
jgi:hypothetical protein